MKKRALFVITIFFFLMIGCSSTENSVQTKSIEEIDESIASKAQVTVEKEEVKEATEEKKDDKNEEEKREQITKQREDLQPTIRDAEEVKEEQREATEPIVVPQIQEEREAQEATQETITAPLSQAINIKEHITDHIITLPQPLAAATKNFCTWGGCGLSPRLYHEPLGNDRFLIGWTDLSGNGHVNLVKNEEIEESYDFVEPVRGLVAHEDGSFAVLLWHNTETPNKMILSKRKDDGSEEWRSELFSGDAVPDFRDIGDSRLTYGNGKYAAYFSVQGISGSKGGHNGDQLFYINDDGEQVGGWGWGCSHSFAQLISYHTEFDEFAAICISDGFPKKGVILNNNNQLYDAGSDGSKHVSAQLGQIAIADDSWKIIFNALNRPCCEGKGIGIIDLKEDHSSSLSWLTDTQGETEWDPSIAKIDEDNFLVGWRTTNDRVYHVGIINNENTFVVDPQEVTSQGIWWGRRDDSFRSKEGKVSWIAGGQKRTDLHLFVFELD